MASTSKKQTKQESLKCPPGEEAIGAALDKYISDSGEHCMFCGGIDLKGGEFRLEPGGVIKQPVTCRECGEQWEDWYALYYSKRLKHEAANHNAGDLRSGDGEGHGLQFELPTHRDDDA